jgi:hypothetical protein
MCHCIGHFLPHVIRVNLLFAIQCLAWIFFFTRAQIPSLNSHIVALLKGWMTQVAEPLLQSPAAAELCNLISDQSRSRLP